jgi:hypothetical protein
VKALRVGGIIAPEVNDMWPFSVTTYDQEMVLRLLDEYAVFRRTSYQEGIKRVQETFRKLLYSGIGCSLVILVLLVWLLGGPRSPVVVPLLSGPPAFIVLSLIAAFSLYLRQVSAGAVELRDKIFEGR